MRSRPRLASPAPPSPASSSRRFNEGLIDRLLFPCRDCKATATTHRPYYRTKSRLVTDVGLVEVALLLQEIEDLLRQVRCTTSPGMTTGARTTAVPPITVLVARASQASLWSD